MKFNKIKWFKKSFYFLKVSLDSRVREVINRNMVDPSPYTFDEAQLQIYTLEIDLALEYMEVFLAKKC